MDEVLVHLSAHRPWTVERHGGDDVVEAVRPKLLEQALHAARFELEHVGRFARLEERVCRRVIHRDLVEVEGVALAIRTPVDQLRRDIDDGQCPQAEEVELHEACRLDVVLVVLGDVDVGLRAEHRHVIPNRTFADDDAGGVHARMSS